RNQTKVGSPQPYLPDPPQGERDGRRHEDTPGDSVKTWPPRPKPLITGYVEGDGLGNAAFAVHALLAAVMTACGTLQLLPGLRARWPRFHRVSGRVFVSTAVALALGGIGQVWLRGTYLSLVPAVAITVDGILIVIFAVYAVATARRGAFDAHRRWALRTFMAANGVWTLRVGYMFVALAFGGAGMTRRMDGDFDRFWVFGCYLVPLVLLELYLWVERRGGPAARFAVAAALGCATLSACIGLGGAVAFMWLPYL
ncbi:MAG: DUF2306 domain-containing protein, partial [Myxococcota bacterium]